MVGSVQSLLALWCMDGSGDVDEDKDKDVGVDIRRISEFGRKSREYLH